MMETWGYVSEPKSFVSDVSISVQDAIVSGKSNLLGRESKIPPSFGNSLFVTSEEGIDNQGFGKRLYSPDAVVGSDCAVAAKGLYTPITSSAVNVYSGDEPSSNSSLIDLKLGRLADPRDSLNFNSSQIAPTVSSVESSTQVKRARASLSSQVPFCQVHGCRKDLSSCKEYHKRHKVCEIHSKSAKVIVKGTEQRFCQQCSRFHLLGEFDDGKRSCRKRLAGHNERRRKPQALIQAGRTRRLFHSYSGSMDSRLLGSTSTTSSLICQDIYPTDLMFPYKYNSNDWNMRRKYIEDGTNNCPQSEITIANGHLQPKSMFSLSSTENLFPVHLISASSPSGGGDLNEATDQNLHKNSMLLDSASVVQGPPGIAATGRALSLLSSQSRNSSIHTTRILVPHASINGLSNKFNPDMVSVEGSNSLGPILISDENEATHFGNGTIHGSECFNSKDRLSFDQGATINLLQLSSQLQRVEHERNYMKMKLDNDALYGLKIT